MCCPCQKASNFQDDRLCFYLDCHGSTIRRQHGWLQGPSRSCLPLSWQNQGNDGRISQQGRMNLYFRRPFRERKRDEPIFARLRHWLQLLHEPKDPLGWFCFLLSCTSVGLKEHIHFLVSVWMQLSYLAGLVAALLSFHRRSLRHAGLQKVQSCYQEIILLCQHQPPCRMAVWVASQPHFCSKSQHKGIPRRW